MSHIPDGTLHAWLDGAAGFESAAEEESFHAHLEVCEDCRARLEEARRLREDAQAILSDSGPDAIEPPAFGELEARAMVRVSRERAGDSDAEVAASVSRVAGPRGAVRRVGDPETTRSGRRPWLSRRVPLAWAASIVMAIGAGWFGNRILQESPVQAARQVAESELAEVSDADESALEEDVFGDETSGDLVRGAAAAVGPQPVDNFKIEDLGVQSEAARRQFAAAPEVQERFGDYQAPDPAVSQGANQVANQPMRSVDDLQAGREVDRDAVRQREASQEGEAFALDARLEKRRDDEVGAVAGNRPQAEEAPAAAEPSPEEVAVNARKSRANADAPAEFAEGAVALDALVVGGEVGQDEAKGDDKELANCFALAVEGWTPPFELPSVLAGPAEEAAEQNGGNVAWTMLADNSVRIRWRSGDQTMLLTARRVSAGALEGSAAVWLESGGALATRGLVRLSPIACP